MKFRKTIFKSACINIITLAVIIAIALLLTSSAFAAEKIFLDLPESDPFYPYVNYLVKTNLIQGYPDGSFRPADSITRAEVAALLVRAGKLNELAPVTQTYSDISPSHWAYTTIERATYAGLIKGYPDQTFRPEAPISRAEACALLLRLTNKPVPYSPLDETIIDIEPAYWARQQIAAALQAGMFTMTSKNTFEPEAQATRAQLARGLAIALNMEDSLSPVGITAGNIRSGNHIAGGADHTLFLNSGGTIWACGGNMYGQLGDGTLIDRYSAPVQVQGLTGMVLVTVGDFFSLALKNDGTVWAWGKNESGQLGDGTTTDRYNPVQVPGLSDVVSVVAGGVHSLALKKDGTVWAWGYNSSGQLGSGATMDSYTPQQVQFLTDVAAIAAGSGHSLAVKSDGTVWAWGENDFGQLGDGTKAHRYTPVQVEGLTGITSVVARREYSLARKSDGTIWAWGQNYLGQLGDGTKTDRCVPVQVLGLSGVVSVSAGAAHVLALKGDGTVWAWGLNKNGQVGVASSSYGPLRLQGMTDVEEVAAGERFSLALKSDGTVWAWGENYADPLADEIAMDSFSPVQVPKIINSIIAADSGNNIGLGNGDSITITFSVNINQPPVNSKAGVDALINFGGKSFGTNYSGTWTDANTLVLTVGNATGADLAVGDTITINAGVDLKTAGGISYTRTSSGTISGTFGKAGVVHFTDTTLEAAVGAALNIPVGNITETEMLGLTSLNASGEFVMYSDKIKNLTGLEYAANLQSLNLTNNNVSDIGVLSKLTNLQTLNLSSNQISDIRALTGLTNLQTINLGNNQISDIEALSGLTNLQTLYLDNNQIINIDGLSRLTNLHHLSLYSNKISAIGILTGLTDLRILNLEKNQIGEIEALTGLTKLQNLYLSDNYISDIGALSSLPDLQNVSIENNPINLDPDSQAIGIIRALLSRCVIVDY
ncbi:MAG: Internalin-A precursor [Pelotomaculum sp. PtaB.Bin013]|uniref:S-layer homology domain-containing protein n=1 Tax=Pelotomaculum isophthalicicum JI TaxID=947010 RepID=A0A9X4JVE4_9FIRM|nr:leucine-rich repeat domain-containing protein [Pelotomaculum isophthalicicum]MDF9408171.1 S-layer homology domain-containing protein [Pelotomaculum isophthalicicum JI]OPX86900.1 MAG: Internalin-A precursor [Pelotomaculum sp. PtaB.Bin013]